MTCNTSDMSHVACGFRLEFELENVGLQGLGVEIRETRFLRKKIRINKIPLTHDEGSKNHTRGRQVLSLPSQAL